MKLGTKTVVRDHNSEYISIQYENSDKIIFSTLIEKKTVAEIWFAQSNVYQYIAKFRDSIAKAHDIKEFSASHPLHKKYPAKVDSIISEITRRVIKNARRLGWYQVKRIMES